MVNKMDPTSRLILLLVAAEFTDKEIVALTDAVRDMRPSELIKRAHAIRLEIGGNAQLAQSRDKGFPEVSISQGPPHAGPFDEKQNFDLRPVTAEISQEVASGLERLLVIEAGLTKIKASELLSNYLLKRHPNRQITPYMPKDGFNRWIKQVSAIFSPSEIMHAAAAIRNSRVHGGRDDWIGKS